jgi:purine-binding chemotaxis protein CheW
VTPVKHPTLEIMRLAVLTFRLGPQRYGLLIEDVVEVAAMVETTPLPGSNAALIGLVNRRGAMLPLLDLRVLFEQPATAVTANSVFIVAAGGEQHIGLVVDEVQQVEYVDPLQFNMVSTSTQYVHGVVTHQNQLIPILSLPQVLAVFHAV